MDEKKRVAIKADVELAELNAPLRGRRAPKPHLRYDKVALRLMADLKAALASSVPAGVTVFLSCTAPIRIANKTAAAVEEFTRALLKRSKPADASKTILGNQIRVRLDEHGAKRAPKVIGFIHNPETDARMLFDMAHAMLELFCPANLARSKPRRNTWLVVTNDAPSSHIGAYRDIYAQLGVSAPFENVLMLFADGKLETLLDAV